MHDDGVVWQAAGRRAGNPTDTDTERQMVVQLANAVAQGEGVGMFTWTLSRSWSVEPAASSVCLMMVRESVVCSAMSPGTGRAGLAPLASLYQPPIPPMKRRLPERMAPEMAWATHSAGGVSNAAVGQPAGSSE